MNTLTSNPTKIAIPLTQWNFASWKDYETWRDTETRERVKLYYYQNHLLVEMGSEGINHANIGDLFSMLFFIWFSQHIPQTSNTFGGCLLEKSEQSSAAPDIVLYIGEDYPRWQTGERRYIDLDRWRIPDLVGEISDTTLSSDLDEKKHLYASLGITEYWAIDVVGRRVFAFQLQENNQYRECQVSQSLTGLPIALLEQTLVRLQEESNISVANWFAEQIRSLNIEGN
ncbi:Uma2 family endonuclease [Spirulina sp. 06S082]|uniref:Uma2 family endonuclease n=1 Tax=Spirulina sp. 06S082 TaxID=3110248 RepID=UPI002B21D9FC|nr:Uma2 family endonuclease [Spirulina sp. 06S082]MEA5468515.1 Uma2 family endonuclease [Spirulina sp. 06S082]